MERIKVCVVTGTRAEYGIWRPVLRALTDQKNIKLQVVVTGMHLLKEFGLTVRDIERDGWPIAARVPMYRNCASSAEGLARGVAGFDAAFAKLKPDVVLVLGDRLEILAAAQAAMCQGRIIGHVHGGETAPGQYDEQIRHAVTKLAQLHFCSTPRAAKRIIQMGEPPERVHIVGAPALDVAAPFAKTSNNKDTRRLQRALALPISPLLLLHPSSGDDLVEYRRTLMMVDTITDTFSDRIVAVGPNNDPGHRGILRAYRDRPRVSLEMSIPQIEFWIRLISHGLLVGNSSSGIIEAASFGCPVVNIGDRQAGRERSGNVIDVPWEAGQAGLEAALHRALSDKTFRRRVAQRKNIYGDGHAAPRIAKIIARLDPSRLSPIKRFHDL